MQYVRKVAFRHAEKLGDLVVMDLKSRKRGGHGRDILYLLDHATSFIVAIFNNCCCNNKQLAGKKFTFY